ncbi:hypothetical protein J6590_063623 [Homalodisca vitripennis]|nr:hypothetical protein J6590_063623 [Homalodisca vitripennis]
MNRKDNTNCSVLPLPTTIAGRHLCEHRCHRPCTRARCGRAEGMKQTYGTKKCSAVLSDVVRYNGCTLFPSHIRHPLALASPLPLFLPKLAHATRNRCGRALAIGVPAIIAIVVSQIQR